MSYEPDENAHVLNSDDFKDCFTLAYLDEQQTDHVRSCSENETPPRAENQALITENCQGWTVRVVARLVRLGIVEQSRLNDIQPLMQRVR